MGLLFNQARSQANVVGHLQHQTSNKQCCRSSKYHLVSLSVGSLSSVSSYTVPVHLGRSPCLPLFGLTFIIVIQEGYHKKKEVGKKRHQAVTGERVWGGKATVDGEGALSSEGNVFECASFRQMVPAPNWNPRKNTLQYRFFTLLLMFPFQFCKFQLS